MYRSVIGYGFLTGLFIVLCAICHPAMAQRFPYEAPRAPEFDRNGNYVATEKQEPARQVRPAAPQRMAPRAPDFGPQNQGPIPLSSAPPSQPASMVSSQPPPQPMVQPPSEPEGPPDCSQYPMMITSAQTREAMQWNAKLFLTCLLKRGWRMDQAKQEVIRVIEAAQGGGR